jgi:flagellar assembly protein FliH
MGAPAKFLFNVDFGAGADRATAKPSITHAEYTTRLAEAESAAHRKGYAAAQNDARVAADRCIADALERIAVHIGQATDALREIETRLEAEAVEVAVAVARKLAAALVAREPFAEIAALARDCFRELISSPHIAVRVNDSLYAAAREKLDDIVRARNFAGRLVVLAEPDIAVGDCCIEWADGGINRNSAATEAAISAAVDRYVTARRNFAGSHETLRRHEDD